MLFAPNSFTPNEDGINDNFKPQIIGVDDDEFGIYIYDRWGDLIYLYEKEYSSWQGWDGRANKKQHGHILLVVAKPEWIKPYRGV